jgi:predicted LPLAT superfamily acyltransferase
MIEPLAAAASRHWAQIGEATFVPGMRLIFWLHRIVGRWPARIILYPVVFWYVAANPAARAASRDYLRRVAILDARLQATRFRILRHFTAFAECLLDKMLLWGDAFNADVEFHGEPLIAEQVASGRGALLICSHLGNLELCRVLSRRIGLKVTVLTHTKHAKKFNELLARLDPGSQLDLMQVTDISPATAMLLEEKIAHGELVAIAGDRVPISAKPLVAWANFLGSAAPFPTGPYVLGHLLECPVFLLFSIKRARTREVHFERLRDSIELQRTVRDAELAVLAQEYAGRLEHFCRRSPLEWFNFYDFWRLPALDGSHAAT